MGSKVLKVFVYPLLFIVSFLLFLYWVFPYEVLKDRVIGMIEEQLGSGLEVDVRELKPYWFTGVDVAGLAIVPQGGDKTNAIFECKRARVRASFLSLIFGRPSVSFALEVGKGEISGVARQTDEMMEIDADFDEFDIGSLKFISERTGMGLSGKIDGNVDLHIDKQKPMRSTGRVSLDLIDMRIPPSELKLGEMNMPLKEEIVLTKGSDARIKLQIEKGVISVENFKFAGGDLLLTITGKVFLAPKAENYRFNLSGSFNPSKKLSDALPFLYIVEQQKQSDGSLPISVTGRLGQPSVKIGTFSVPL